MERETRLSRFLTRVLNSVYREPRIRRKGLIYLGVMTGVAGAIVGAVGITHFNEGQEARQRLQVLDEAWLNSLTEDQKVQLRDAEARTGFLKTAPLADQTMRNFRLEWKDFIRTHEGGEIFDKRDRGLWLAPWEIGFGASLVLLGGPLLALAGLQEKPRTR